MSARDLLTRPLAHDDSVIACKFLNCLYDPPVEDNQSINQSIDQSNGQYMLVTASLDGSIKIWSIDPLTPSLKSPLFVINQSIACLPCTSIAVSPISHTFEPNQSINQSHQAVSQSINSLFFTSHMGGLIQGFDAMTGQRLIDFKIDVSDGRCIEIIQIPNKSINQSINQAINQSNNQCLIACSSILGHVTVYTIPSIIGPSTNQSIIQSRQTWKTSLSINQSTNQQNNQSNNQSITCMSSNGQYLLVGSVQGDICLIDCLIGQQIWRVFSPPVCAIRSISSNLSINQSVNQSIRIYAGCSDGTIRVYQLNDLSTNQSVNQSNKQSNNQSISQSNDQFLTRFTNQTISQLTVHSGWITSCLCLKMPQIALNTQSINLLTTSTDQSIKLTDESGETVHTYQSNQSINQSVWCAHSKASMLAVGCDDGSIRLMQLPIA